MTGGLRLLRLEVRRNVMLWLLPLIAALFWFVVYRRTTAFPPLWNVRAMAMQTAVVSVFVPTVVGAAAWAGSREARHGLLDLLAGTARPRWARQLAAWAATTGWALAAYVGCVGVLYTATERQATWGGPLWWPAAVGAASLPAFTAIGFAAGALLPSRFTAPLVAIATFLALEVSAQFIHGYQSYWQISPLVAGPWNGGSTEGLATFYPYLPDLPLVQMAFLAGLTAALMGILGLPAGSGGQWLRMSAAACAAVGLLTATTSVALAGTGRLDPHGMIAIPAVHNAADDRPVPFTRICSSTAIPVCLHPAYAVYLPTVTAALEPVLNELAGLPGAPVRINQSAAIYQPDAGNGMSIRRAGPALTGTPPVFQLLLPSQLLGSDLTTSQLTDALRTDTARAIVTNVITADRDTSPAQRAVIDAILGTFTTEPEPAVAAAARRFAALPTAARRAWLMQNLVPLRAGQITLQQLP
jgi:hypothetical protein